MRFNTLHHIQKMLQNCWRKSFVNTENPGASGAPHKGSVLDPLETLSGPQTPHRLLSPLTQNPGSVPGAYRYFHQYFSYIPVYIVAVNFIGGWNRDNQRNHRLAASHWQALSQSCIEYTSPWDGFNLYIVVVICTSYIRSYKNNVHFDIEYSCTYIVSEYDK